VTKTLGIKRTNFPRYERLDFRDIIEEVNNIYGESHGPNITVQAKLIRFKLFLPIPPLKCIELIDNATNEIIEYYYDWQDSSTTLMKFHAHYHPDEAPQEVKQFDPFHLHVKYDENDNEAKKREPDNEYKCLYNVLMFIKRHAYITKYTTKRP